MTIVTDSPTAFRSQSRILLLLLLVVLFLPRPLLRHGSTSSTFQISGTIMVRDCNIHRLCPCLHALSLVLEPDLNRARAHVRQL